MLTEHPKGDVAIWKKPLMTGRFYFLRIHPSGIQQSYMYLQKTLSDICCKTFAHIYDRIALGFTIVMHDKLWRFPGCSVGKKLEIYISCWVQLLVVFCYSNICYSSCNLSSLLQFDTISCRLYHVCVINVSLLHAYIYAGTLWDQVYRWVLMQVKCTLKSQLIWNRRLSRLW